MARKGGKRGGSSAARSAAAKKGWETRRRGGVKAKPTKPTARKATAPSKPKKAASRRGTPKTTSARGRALTNQRRAADLVRASRGGRGPSARAIRSLLTAQRARAFYAATGGGKKRSAVKPRSAAKVGKQIRAQGTAKAAAARAKVAGRPRSRVVTSRPRTGKPIRRAVLKSRQSRFTSDGVEFRLLGLSSTKRQEDRLRQSYFRSEYGTKTQAGRKAMLLRGTSNRDRALSRLRRAKLAPSYPAPRRPAAQRSAAAKRAPAKVDLSMPAIARRRSRANTERSSVAGGAYNMKLDTRSRIIRSAANAIYNRQRQVARASGGAVNAQVARAPIGILRGLSGSTRQRADQLHEQARKRVVAGRRRR